MDTKAIETTPSAASAAPTDAAAHDEHGIIAEEEKVLARVLRTVEARSTQRKRPGAIDYDQQLIELRDQIRNARIEDVPPLIEEMERLAGVAARRAKVA